MPSSTLGLGAGADPLSERELRYLEDDSPQVLPTLHGSEAVSIPRPIPPSGTGRAVTRFTEIWNKGKAAVI
jgi:hypothetical protein